MTQLSIRGKVHPDLTKVPRWNDSSIGRVNFRVSLPEFCFFMKLLFVDNIDPAVSECRFCNFNSEPKKIIHFSIVNEFSGYFSPRYAFQSERLVQ